MRRAHWQRRQRDPAARRAGAHLASEARSGSHGRRLRRSRSSCVRDRGDVRPAIEQRSARAGEDRARAAPAASWPPSTASSRARSRSATSARAGDRARATATSRSTSGSCRCRRAVRDYVLLHELMHIKQQNHSPPLLAPGRGGLSRISRRRALAEDDGEDACSRASCADGDDSAAAQRCTLRRWRTSDAASLVRHANNLNVARHLRDRFPHPYTPQGRARLPDGRIAARRRRPTLRSRSPAKRPAASATCPATTSSASRRKSATGSARRAGAAAS